MLHVHDPEWTFGRSLDVAGVYGDSRHLIEVAYNAGDVDTIRSEFSCFSFRERNAALGKSGSIAKGD